jgi:Sulfatase
MNLKQFISTVLRFALALVWLLTSIYALLAYVPFTFRQVISINLIPAVQTFARIQPFALATTAILFALYIAYIEKRKKLALEDRRELTVLTILSLALAVWNLPAHLQNDTQSLIWSFVCMLPPLWISFLSFRDLPQTRAEAMSPAPLIFAAAVTAVFSALLSGFTYQTLDFSSVAVITVFLAGIGALLAIVEQFVRSARLTLQSALIQYSAIAALGLGFFISDQVSAAIAFFGPLALFWSYAFAATLSLLLISSGSRFTAGSEPSRLPSLLWPSGRFTPGLIGLLGLPLLAGLFFVAHKRVAQVDWNGLGQKIMVLAFWVFAFVLILKPVHVLTLWIRQKTNLLSRVITTALLTLGLVAAAAMVRLNFLKIQSDRRTDAAFVLAKSVVLPETGDSTLFAFLQSHTNLPKTTQITLPSIELAPSSTSLRERPFIFFFVIDSLRRDYVSAYNPQVTFTPSIEKFAAESSVFKNAFTRYGATGLSEPSIWAGRMFPHQMYPQPFDAINLLHKLVRAENYPMWISRDSILKEILRPEATDQDLDVGVGTQDLDLCKTTAEVVERLKKDSSKPVFVYSQSQNIHISVLARGPAATDPSSENEKVTAPGFNAPYATALKRVDTCFGNFVESLKTLGIYDKSLIVLTSDHGDSLGEEGRFGHAYTVYPEIMRIPLLIHAPAELTAGRTMRSDLVFSTDIAPTLASLLGHDQPSTHWWEGRSLFVKSGPSSPESSTSHLVMSSYGPVAGLVSETGDSIRIADAINFTMSMYQINEQGSANVGVNATAKSESDKLIKEKFTELYEAYGL